MERTDGVSALSWWTTVFGDRDARDVYQCGCGHGAACGTTVGEDKQRYSGRAGQIRCSYARGLLLVRGDYNITSFNDHVRATYDVNRRAYRPLKGKDYITCVDTSLRHSKAQHIWTQGVGSAAKLHSCMSRILTESPETAFSRRTVKRRRMDRGVDFEGVCGG